MNDKCCENCCKLHQTGDKYYCFPVDDIKIVYDLNNICNQYEDCKVTNKHIRNYKHNLYHQLMLKYMLNGYKYPLEVIKRQGSEKKNGKKNRENLY